MTLPAIGAPVVVTITGTRSPLVGRHGRTGFRTVTGGMAYAPADDPDVVVTELEPERATLEDVLAAHVEDYDNDRGWQGGCSCGNLRPIRADAWEEAARVAHVAYIEHVAAELRAAGLAR